MTFTPTHEWQDVPPDAVLPPGLEIQLDMETGTQRARIPPTNGNGHARADEPDFESSYAAVGTWPDPIPLYAEHEKAEPYPITVLPPILRNACESYQTFGQQPIEMVAGSALSASSLACQGLADVSRDGNLIGPCSLLSLSVAVSGERKTSCDLRMKREIDRWQLDKIAEQATAIAAAERRLAIWQAEHDGMMSKLKRLAGANDAEQSDILKSKLLLHDSEQPKVPVGVKLFYQDVTQEKLASALSIGWPSSSLWSDEAGLIVGSHAMSEDSALRFLALLNILWDGGTFDRQRETRSCAHVRGRRFTASLMMQPSALAKLVAAGDGIARGVGALARFLLAWPTSTIGTRPYREGDLEAPALRAYDARLRSLLNRPLPVDKDGALEPPVLRLSNKAFAVWRKLHDNIEAQLGRRGEFSELPDFGAKAADQAARIACVLHVIEHGPEGEISAETMVAGATIAAWHLVEARRIFAIIGQSGEAADAELLLEWLRDRPSPPSLTESLQFGPHRLRDKKRRDTAIAKLVEHGFVRTEQQNGITHIVINPKATQS